MIDRERLAEFLRDMYQYAGRQDYCENGLQVEGKREIRRLALGVSFNMPLLERAIAGGADAIIVHHGFFGQNFFTVKGEVKEKIRLLLKHDISLFGVHLPMDAHGELGHNALLMKALGAREWQALEVGYVGLNAEGHDLETILEILHKRLHEADALILPTLERENVFSFRVKYGFQVLANGPGVPVRLGVITGGGSGYYEKALNQGADTFICGDIREHTPAYSLETRSNFINLGHYYSEKPGLLALRDVLAQTLAVETFYCEVPHPV